MISAGSKHWRKRNAKPANGGVVRRGRQQREEDCVAILSCLEFVNLSVKWYEGWDRAAEHENDVSNL